MKTAAIIIAIVVVAGAAIYLASRSGNNNSGSPDGSSSNVQDQISPAAGINTQGNDQGIMLQSVDMPEAGFLVVHTDNNGQPGAIVGVSPLLQSGNNTNVQIPANLMPGQQYIIEAHADTNGNQTFDANADQPMKDSQGNVMMQPFTAPQAGTQGSVNPNTVDPNAQTPVVPQPTQPTL